MRLVIAFCCLFVSAVFAQQPQTFRARTVAFYNVENLFDVANDSLVLDDERTPKGAYAWTLDRYQKKIAHIAKVIAAIGKGTTGGSPDIVGLCEVENRSVLQDLINHPMLKKLDYGIIHEDAPDERGIDVALLYKKEVFLPIAFKSRRLLLFNEDGFRDYTRDQLVVSGLLDGDTFHFMVNHWPSRSGGELRSRPYRLKAAALNKRIIDSLRYLDPKAKIISMGDLNDDPTDASLKKVLRVQGTKEGLDSVALFGPMEALYKKGWGTLAYRDQWNLFDQFVLTANLLQKDNAGFWFWKAGIFAPDYLKNPSGRYKGYPFRTYVGTTYQGGYADHFPIYLFLLKEVGAGAREK